MDMDNRRWEKLAAGTGVAFVALILASSFVVAKMPPKIDDPINKIGRFFGEHHNGLLWGGWLGMLGTLFGLWFIGTVAHWVRRQDQPRLATIAFGGGVAAFSMALVATLLGTTIAPPAPWMTRAAIRAAAFGAAAQHSEATSMVASPTMRIRRRPKWSASAPASNSRDATVTR